MGDIVLIEAIKGQQDEAFYEMMSIRVNGNVELLLKNLSDNNSTMKLHFGKHADSIIRKIISLSSKYPEYKINTVVAESLLNKFGLTSQ